MSTLNLPVTQVAAAVVLLLTLTIQVDGQDETAKELPVADAGASRYAATAPVQLYGGGSHGPGQSGELSYRWTQVGGPLVAITDGETVAPTISGSIQVGPRGDTVLGPFVQTDEIQVCEFELVVTWGDLASLPEIVRVVIVPVFGSSQLQLYNTAFDPDKPTIVYFGGGDCTFGSTGYNYARLPFESDGWLRSANVIWFPIGYSPDISTERTYYKYGDMLIVYLSSVAPEYAQLVQVAGWSTGGQPAVDVGIRLNETYRDPRYAVNRVTLLDAAAYCRDHSEGIERYLASRVDGEQCWLDNYVASISEHHPLDPRASYRLFHTNVLNVEFDGYDDQATAWVARHRFGNDWSGDSLHSPTAMSFNAGIVAGAYLSVVGPGRNLQLASTPGQQLYRFRLREGLMEMADEQAFPGKLPEPVTLMAWTSVSGALGDVGGAVLSCYRSHNAVGYELLFGSDPRRVAEYRIVSDTPLPPMEVIEGFVSDETWWTIRVRDQYGSTIHADPLPLDLTDLAPLTVRSSRSGRRYGLIEHAILEAEPGDTIVLEPAVYVENIEIAMPLTITSLDPSDPLVVAETIVTGRDARPTVTFGGVESAGSMLAGVTIQSKSVGISCQNATPTIQECVVNSPDGIALQSWYGHNPHLINCTFVGRIKIGDDVGLIAYWTLDETEGVVAHDYAGENDGTVHGDAIWQPDGGRIHGALLFDGVDDYIHTDFILDPSKGAFSAYAWIKGGAPGQIILSQGTPPGQTCVWLGTDTSNGALMTGLMAFPPFIPWLRSEAVITDDQWHEVGLTRDGKYRYLYVDGQLVAKDETVWPTVRQEGGLHIGAGSHLEAGSFWFGHIDDIRVFDQALTPDDL